MAPPYAMIPPQAIVPPRAVAPPQVVEGTPLGGGGHLNQMQVCTFTKLIVDVSFM